MLCTTCKNEAPADAAFCPKCGSALGEKAAPRQGTPIERMQAAQGSAGPNQEPEHELWRGTYSPKAMYSGWAFAIFVTIAGVILAVAVPSPAWIAVAILVPVVWIGVALTLAYRRLSVSYTVTSQRFLLQRGLLSQVNDRVLLIDIDDVAYKQGLIDRFVNVGTITLRSADATDPVLNLPGIDNVQHVTNLIDDARREERRKRAIYMANV